MYTRMQTPNLTLNFGGKGRGVESGWEGWRCVGGVEKVGRGEGWRDGDYDACTHECTTM